MQEKGQSRRRNLDRSEDESDIEGKPKVYSSLPLPLALSFAHLATTTTICTWKDCEGMSQARCVCEKKGKVEEETLTDLKMILTPQDNLKTRWFFAFAFGTFRCTPGDNYGDNYGHMHMEGLRRHVARWHARKKAK